MAVLAMYFLSYKKTPNMNKEYTINLIDSIFTKEEAANVLLDIFSSKIKFHELKNMGYKERFGHVDKAALQRIDDLKRSRQALLNILENANESNCNLLVKSNIHIQITEKSKETQITHNGL
jgi:hypothetical protein